MKCRPYYVLTLLSRHNHSAKPTNPRQAELGSGTTTMFTDRVSPDISEAFTASPEAVYSPMEPAPAMLPSFTTNRFPLPSKVRLQGSFRDAGASQRSEEHTSE